MGLDQYVFDRVRTSVDDQREPIFTWRKHAKLQEYFEHYWYKVLKNTDEINCEDVLLTQPLIANLRNLIEQDELPESPGGFFYGHQFQDESSAEYKEQDLKFCDWALELLEAGEQPVYHCWY